MIQENPRMPRIGFKASLRFQPRGDQVLIWLPGEFRPAAVPTGVFLGWVQGLEALAQGGVEPGAALPTGIASMQPLLEGVESAGLAPSAPLLDLPRPRTWAALPVALRTSGSLCLQSLAGALAAWSAPLGAYVRLSHELLKLLLLGAGGRPTTELAASVGPDGQALLASLRDAGLLMPSRVGEGKPVSSGTFAADAVHLNAGDPWAGLKPDGRRPLYFVTHHVDHLPLALGMLRAHLVAHRDGALLEHYMPLPIVSLDVRGMQNLFRRFGPGIWLFSNYLWSEAHNRGLSAAVKSAHPRNVTIHGGPSAPKYEEACREYMRANPHVDFVVRGEGEATLVELLEALAEGRQPDAGPETVTGITYFADARRTRLVRTPDRPRLRQLDQLPSPYLGGHFDHYGGQVIAAILETNRGCPFGCTFCDWGSATAAKIRSFDLERVKAEIDWMGRKRIRVLWIADANFGIFPKDVEIASHIAETKARYGYPREVVVNYPKNATEKIARIVKIFAEAGICGQGIISIQTTDPATLAAIRRDNIKTSKYDELGEIFRRENLPLSTDLMIGLPGATLGSFKADLQYYFDDDVGVKAYRTQLLPNSPMADPEYMRKHAIRVDDQQYLVATSSYGEAELSEMLALWNAFDLSEGYALLRYALRYLQWDHGLPAAEVLYALVREVETDPARYPTVAWMLAHFLRERQVLGGWEPFYREVAAFVRARYGIGDEPGWLTALEVNRLMMPQAGRRFPDEVRLRHDFVAYFRDHSRRGSRASRPLGEHPPGSLTITDPYRLCEIDYAEIEQYDNHQVFYELGAPISRRRSKPSFVLHAQAS
jgi:radical SAM superfamily enzyme YgiQ (UPF0313 family)